MKSTLSKTFSDELPCLSLIIVSKVSHLTHSLNTCHSHLPALTWNLSLTTSLSLQTCINEREGSEWLVSSSIDIKVVRVQWDNIRLRSNWSRQDLYNPRTKHQSESEYFLRRFGYNAACIQLHLWLNRASFIKKWHNVLSEMPIYWDIHGESIRLAWPWDASVAAQIRFKTRRICVKLYLRACYFSPRSNGTLETRSH